MTSIGGAHVFHVNSIHNPERSTGQPGLLASGSAMPSSLRWYFHARRTIDAGELARLSVEDIARVRKARQRFAGRRYERLYADWLSQGDGAFDARTASGKPELLIQKGQFIARCSRINTTSLVCCLG
jgi:hypothetical protein